VFIVCQCERGFEDMIDERLIDVSGKRGKYLVYHNRNDF